MNTNVTHELVPVQYTGELLDDDNFRNDVIAVMQSISNYIGGIEYSLNPGETPVRLERLFRASFLMSNGMPFLQFLIQYNCLKLMSFTSVDDGEEISNFFETHEVCPKKYYPPKKHADMNDPAYAKDLDTWIIDLWGTYKHIAENINSPLNIVIDPEELDPEGLEELNAVLDYKIWIPQAIMTLCDADVIFMKRGRPGQTISKRARSSMLRDYVLFGKTTHSDEVDYFNRILRGAISFFASDQCAIPSSIRTFNQLPFIKHVAQVWESYNEGEFFPPDISLQLGKCSVSGAEGDTWTIL